MFPRRRPMSSQHGSGSSTAQTLNQRSRAHHDSSLAKGIFKNGSWYCECTPELPAQRFQVKKEGKNQGRWFYTCQKPKGQGCGFFLWEDDASKRMEAAVFNGGDREVHVQKATEQQQSPPKKRKLPWESNVPASPEKSARKLPPTRKLEAEASEEFNEETTQALSQMMEQVERNAISVEQRLPNENPTTPRKTHQAGDLGSLSRTDTGLPTPSTTTRTATHNTGLIRGEMPTTPTPSARSHNVLLQSPSNPSKDADLLPALLEILSESKPRIELPLPTKNNMTEVIRRYDARARGYQKGRDKAREVIQERDTQIGQLKNVIHDLEGQIEELKSIREMSKR